MEEGRNGTTLYAVFTAILSERQEGRRSEFWPRAPHFWPEGLGRMGVENDPPGGIGTVTASGTCHYGLRSRGSVRSCSDAALPGASLK